MQAYLLGGLLGLATVLGAGVGFVAGFHEASPDPYHGMAMEDAFRAGYVLRAFCVDHPALGADCKGGTPLG